MATATLPSLATATIPQLQRGLASGAFTSTDLVRAYIARTGQVNHILRPVLSISTAAALAEAGALAAEDCSPIPDGRGPVDYKRHLAGVLTKRALRRAAARALHQEA